MILYFSGNGNSRYVAEKLGKLLGERVLFIPKTDPKTLQYEGESLGVVFPVYSWGVPPIVQRFIYDLNERFIAEARKRKIWMVCTCGDETGKTPEMFRWMLGRRGLELDGAWSVIMPNTYVLLPGFDVDSRKVKEDKLDRAPKRIQHIADCIQEGRWERDVTKGSWPTLKSQVVYRLFRRWGINTSKWHWTSECIQCGKCAASCPVGNITMKGGHPRWGSDCTSCLACYNVCPAHAVEYGNATIHKGQYRCKR